jgi:hypothetical protein
MWQILNIKGQDSYLVATVQHFNPDGSPWFIENYRWQGREGGKQKRASDENGELLLDDGSPAPKRLGSDKEEHQYLPAGRQYKFLPGTHISDESLLSLIRTTHEQRLVSGWPQGYRDSLRSVPTSGVHQRDQDGIAQMVSTFKHLEDYSE